MLSSLGLALNDVEDVNLTQADIDSILTWLNGQSLHFGDSAFKTVIDLLAKENPTKTYEELLNENMFQEIGADCIKVDILTGVISKDPEGDLLISMYAMAKVAEVNGLTIYGERIDFGELKNQLALNDSIILHITGNHYVVLKYIDETEGTVTYKDLSVGADGQDITLSRAEFMEEWQGYVLSKSEIQNTVDDSLKYLNESQEKNIRGSGWWQDFWKGVVNFFQKIIAPVALILIAIAQPQTIPAILGYAMLGLNVMIQTISFVVRTGTLMVVALSIGTAMLPGVISVVASAAGSVFSSIASSIPAAIKGAFTTAINIFSSIADAVKGIATGIGHIFTPFLEEAVAISLFTHAIGSVVAIGTNIAFQSMKLDPTLSNIASMLFSGIALGSISTGLDVIATALKTGTMVGMGLIGEAAGLDDSLTRLAALVGGTIVGGTLGIDAIEIGGTAYDSNYLVNSVVFKFADSLFYDGMLDISNMLGIDERISRLAGLVIRSTLRNGLGGPFGSGGTPGEADEWLDVDRAWQGLMDGLLQGAMNISLNYVSQQLDLHPLVTELGFTAVAGIIEGLFNLNPEIPAANKIFDEVWEGYTNATLNLFRLGLQNPNDPWQQAAYIANIMEFSEIVQEQGLLNAIETYATSMFRQSTVQSMINIAGSVSNYIQQQLNDPTQYVTGIKDGKTLKYIKLPTDLYMPDVSPLEQDYLALIADPGAEDVYGMRQGNLERWGIFGVDELRNLGLLSGEMRQYLEAEVEAWQKMENGLLSYVELHDPDGDVFLVVSPDGEGGYITGRTFSEWLNNKFTTDVFDISFGYGDYYDVEKKILYDSLTDEEKQILANFGLNNINDLGTVFYGVDDVGKVALATNFNEDVLQFLNNHPDLTYEVISMFIKHSEDSWGNNYSLHRNNWVKKMFKYNGYDTSTYISDVENYLRTNTDLPEDRIKLITDKLSEDMSEYGRKAGFKPSAKLNFVDETVESPIAGGGKIENSFHAGYSYLKGNDQLLWGKENSFWKGVLYGGITTNIYGKIGANIGAESGIFYVDLNGETGDIIQRTPTFITEKNIGIGGSLALEEGAHVNLVINENKHDFYGFAEESTDGFNLGFRYEFLTPQGVGIDFSVKIQPGEGLFNKKREPATQDERDAQKLYDSFKNKQLINNEDKEQLKTYIVNQVNAEIQRNTEANQYFQGNPDVLNNLYATIDTFADNLTGKYFEYNVSTNVPSIEELLNIINKVIADGASTNLSR